MASEATSPELITVKIDDVEVAVPKGTNLIEAAKIAGVEIPHYCYHPHLSVPGNCRMCQVEVVGAPKLMIGCHTEVRPDMEIRTHHSSPEVKKAQESTLEFILINHPLDCTICDQSGHCKLQDYHYDYNGKSSRFLEEKEHKVKAEPLGPHVILDGERCIMCTRCIRFCEEVTETGELGMLNRGDRSVISINPGKELDNALSGTVVDLCPVGALTHRDWRFNTRIWYTKQTDSICPGCSTGCNVKVAERDGEIVHVKARLNSAVNKEWLCDEGRYGFHRFLPENRLTTIRERGSDVPAADTAKVFKEASRLKGEGTLVFVSPDLLFEEYFLLKSYLEKFLKNARVALQFVTRSLSPVEAKLISPDYASNFRGALLAGLVDESLSPAELEAQYKDKLQKLREGAFTDLLIIGQRAIRAEDVDIGILERIRSCELTVGMFSDALSDIQKAVRYVFPVKSILESSGLLVNNSGRVQYSERVVDAPAGTFGHWEVLNSLAKARSGTLTDATDDRALTLSVFRGDARFGESSKDMTIRKLKKEGGIAWNS